VKRLPIGISDFKELIENDYYFVDTSKMIADIYKDPAKIALITRPRRFGKTLNMSMLYYFFDNSLQTENLFKGLRISENTEVFKEINSFPTIFISFKDIKNNKLENAFDNMKFLFSDMYKKHMDSLEMAIENQEDKKFIKEIISMNADEESCKQSLRKLIEYLSKAHSKPVLLIIDEYDVPIQSGWTYGYYDDIIDFMRIFLSAALKDNSNLFKGVLTGIYRVAKESIFSGLNNLSVFTVLDKDYSEYFGFTVPEMNKLLEYFNSEQDKNSREEISEWYNGYQFGGNVIYNPWSIISYLRYRNLKPYWINTSSNDLIINLIEENLKADDDFRKAIEMLISGGMVTQTIDDSSALRDLQTKPDSIWALFVFSGYLKPEKQTLKKGKYECDLKIPNEEVFIFFQDTVFYWIEKSGRRLLTSMTTPLVEGEAEEFCEKLKKYTLETLSYYDLKGEPENTYHMILLGMFAYLSDAYWIKSNRESGHGRYDVLLKAKDKEDFSAVIEIKAITKNVKEAMKQINDKMYVQELKTEGYTKIMKIALGIDGKKIETIVESD